MNKMDFLKGFSTAALLMPQHLARAAFCLTEADRLGCEAFRIRLGRPLMAVIAGEERLLEVSGQPALATADDVDALLAKVTGSSVHSYNGQMVRGYVTTEQGHRLGLCGETVWENGVPVTVRGLSSVNLRIAKQALGVAEGLCGQLYEGDFESTLIVAPPGAGKTTLLRDMARWLSYRMSVSVVDERHELAACRRGEPRFDLGRCDVLSGSPKAQGIEQLIRSMAPRVIALDEITEEADVWAVSQAAYCGCGFVTTAHGGAVQDLARRPVYRELMAQGIFRNIILIENHAGRRVYRIWREGGARDDQGDRAYHDRGVVLGHGVFHEQKSPGTGVRPEELSVGPAHYQG